MGATKELALRMSEQEYMQIPEGIRENHLRTKIVSESVNDFEELRQDKAYSDLYKEYKKAKQALEQRAYELREQKRNKLKQL